MPSSVHVRYVFDVTNWGQEKETLLSTYKALGGSIANYASPVRSTNVNDTSLENIQSTHNEALRTITGSPKSSPCAISGSAGFFILCNKAKFCQLILLDHM